MSANWELSAADYQEEFDDWFELYDIQLDRTIVADEATPEQMSMLEELDKKNLVWTEHGTCEDEMISPGLTILGDFALTGQKATGCGCWQTYCFYVAAEPYDDSVREDSSQWIYASVHLPCSKCNPKGENEDEESYDPDCEECEGEGFATHYFD